MYKTVFGFNVTFVSDDLATEETKLPISNITNTINSTAEPRNDAKNVLKNDFMILGFIIRLRLIILPQRYKLFLFLY